MWWNSAWLPLRPARRVRLIPLLGALLLAGCTLATAPPAPTPTGPRLVTAIPPVADDPLAPAATSAPPSAITPPPRTCTDAAIAGHLRAVPPYRPAAGPWVAIVGSGLAVREQPFRVRGITYLPASGDLFATALPTLEADLARLRALGLNTLRIAPPYPALFTCPGHGAVPLAAGFAQLDALVRLISAYGLRVILVLHQDAAAPPSLYTGSGDVLAQTAYLVTRYRQEPALLAWDLRDAGDADYPIASREVVLAWLSRTAAAVRQIDPRHPLTAGWHDAPEDTLPLVDIVSLGHFGSVADLRQRIAGLRALTAKPLLLGAFGVSTDQVNETAQANALRALIRAAEGDRLAGWVLGACYDGVAQGAYGLWRADGSPKPAVQALTALLAES